MSVATSIEWAHHTFNPWWGCVKVSPACTHCYAENIARRFGHHVWGADAPRRFFMDPYWAQPIEWNRAAIAAGERRRVFCASMADVFEDRREYELGLEVEHHLDTWRDRLWALIEETPGLDWLLLTKRPENMVRMTHRAWPREWPANVWAGTTAENQELLAQRLLHLFEVPAVVRFLSIEPLLGRIMPWCVDVPGLGRTLNAHTGRVWWIPDVVHAARVHWIIVGGESGPGARPLFIDDLRQLISECRHFGTPIFVKQLGANVWVTLPDGVQLAFPGIIPSYRADVGDDPKGGDMSGWPEDLRVRQVPVGPFARAVTLKGSA